MCIRDRCEPGGLPVKQRHVAPGGSTDVQAGAVVDGDHVELLEVVANEVEEREAGPFRHVLRQVLRYATVESEGHGHPRLALGLDAVVVAMPGRVGVVTGLLDGSSTVHSDVGLLDL